MVVMQAHVDGKTVKKTTRRNGSVLRAFNWQYYDYDIVEEPIVRYMLVANNKNAPIYPMTYTVYKEAKEVLDNSSSAYKIVKLVQDMDFNSED